MSQITPYVCVADARAAIDWWVTALGAVVVVDPILMEDGRIGHAELEVDGARWMVSDEFDSAGVAAPAPGRGAAVTLHLTVQDCDAAVARALEHGATLDRGPEDNPHAGRVAVFRDPSGHRWFLNTPIDHA